MLHSVAILAIYLTVWALCKVVIVKGTSALEAFKTFLVIVAKLSRHLLRFEHLFKK